MKIEHTLPAIICFTVKHNPGHRNHLIAIAENYLRSKGVAQDEGDIHIKLCTDNPSR